MVQHENRAERSPAPGWLLALGGIALAAIAAAAVYAIAIGMANYARIGV